MGKKETKERKSEWDWLGKKGVKGTLTHVHRHFVWRGSSKKKRLLPVSRISTKDQKAVNRGMKPRKL